MKTRILRVHHSDQARSVISEAVKVLAQDGLVAFPTETVYGLAANADLTQCLERLSQIKQRPPDKPFTLHIGQKSLLDHYVPKVSLLNRHFLRRAWPGPLTAVFILSPLQQELIRNSLSRQKIQTLYYNNSIGVRLPDHPLAQQLLSSVDAPIVAPSANLSGREAPTSADDVLEQLNGQIELILDAGPTRYRKSSTVVQLDGDDLKILRQGVLDAGAIQRMRSVHFLFVCTGNTCRSPMAAGFCRSELAEKLSCPVDQLEKRGYKVSSAGVMACEDGSATGHAIQACWEAGINISNHRARLLTTELINEADYVFVMEHSHRQTVLRMAPEAGARTVLLASDGDIEDPIGMVIEQYRACADRIERAVRQRLSEFL